MSDQAHLPEPPKFRGKDTPMPSNVGEAMTFWRWLRNIWQKAYEAITAAQSIALNVNPPSGPGPHEVAGSAVAISRALQQASTSKEPGLPVEAARIEPRPPVDELNALMAAAMTRQTIPFRGLTHGAIVDTHGNRRGVGVCNTNATAVTWVSGDTKFFATMVGKPIAINYVMYTVASFITDTSITLTSSAGVQAGVGWMYQAYFPWEEAKGTGYLETDRKILYMAADAYGFVNTSGTAVSLSGTLTSYSYFNPAWVGRGIVINGVTYQIASVTNASNLVLATSAGSQTGVAWTVEVGAWTYTSGEYLLPYIANKPTDLWLDDFGFIMEVFDYQHRYVWVGNSWTFAAGDPGSGWYAPVSPSRYGGLWGAADGSSYYIAAHDATIQIVTTDDLTGDVVIQGGARSAQKAATPPEWDALAKTEDAGSHYHAYSTSTDANIDTVDVQNGSGTTVADSNHLHTQSGNTSTDGNHYHGLTDTNAILKAPSETDGAMPLRISIPWYIRR